MSINLFNIEHKALINKCDNERENATYTSTYIVVSMGKDVLIPRVFILSI